MTIQIFDTMSGKLEKFKPLDNKKVGIYVCGPTVYDWAHLGHARTYIAFDVIIRWLKFSGYKVFHVQNIADLEMVQYTRVFPYQHAHSLCRQIPYFELIGVRVLCY